MHPKLTKEVEEQIFYALYDKIGDYKVEDQIHFYEIEKIGQQTYRASGQICLEGIVYNFEIRDGDGNGSEVLEFEEE
jgi:hypothetical protein